MSMNIEPHPDHYLQQTAVKSITSGGKQAQQTEAHNAYFDVFEATGDKGKAEEAYWEIHKKYSDGKTSH